LSLSVCQETAWIASQFDRDFTGYAIECGAWDGTTGSLTHDLESAGWKVLCIEPNVDIEGALRAARDIVIVAAASDRSGRMPFYVHTNDPPCYSSLAPSRHGREWKPDPNALWKIVDVPVKTLTTMLDEVGFPRLDALVLDTEGTEMEVLDGLDFGRFRPKCMVVESWEDNSPTKKSVIERGYEFKLRIGVNDCFLDGTQR